MVSVPTRCFEEKSVLTKRLAGNEILPLDTPSSLWQIQSGTVGIFSIAWQNERPVGTRHYLFSAKAGDLICGCKPTAIGLVAIALEPTVLVPTALQLSKRQVSKRQSSSTCNFVSTQNLSSWLERFSQIEGFPTPQPPGLEIKQATAHLESGDRYAFEKNVWLLVKQGKALWLSNQEMSLSASSGLFPAVANTWIEALELSEVEVYPFEQLEPTESEIAGAISRGLSLFHQFVLLLIEQIQAKQQQLAAQQLQQKQQLDRQTTHRALQGLTSLLAPEDNSFLSAKTPLLVAAGAVGRALGVTVRPPSKSESAAHSKQPLEQIARASQLRLRHVLLEDSWWKKDSGPILAYRQGSYQPVAILPAKGNRYELLDPVTLTRSPVTQAVAESLEPTAAIFYRPLPEGDLNAWKLLKFAFAGRKRDIWIVLLAGVATTLLGMAIPQATAVLIDNAIPYGSRGILLQIGLLLLVSAFGRACFQFAQAIATMRIEIASDASLQAAVWDRLLKLPTAFFRDYATGDLQSRVSSITAIRRQLSGTALSAILSGVFALLNLGLMFYYSPHLAVLALLVAILIASVTIVSGAILLKKQRPLLELDGELNGLMVQLINGVSKLRLAGAEPRAFAQWANRYRQQVQLELSTQRLEDAVDIFNTVIPTVTAIGLFWLVSALINPMRGSSAMASSMDSMDFSTGTFLAFSAAFAIFINGITNLSLTLIEVLEVIPLWQRSQPILEAQPETNRQKGDPGRLTGRICLDRVTFRYREDGPLILENITVEAHPGEFVALVGPSGSGKSTVMRLLLGFETPQSGTIYYDSQDISGLDITAVRRQLGVVLQNGHINAGSIFENISGGALISQQDAWRAAEMAGLANDVRSFPMQMHTVISEGGSNLSGGQRQRLVIARALALNPKILLLDEATSALDNRTQQIVSESLSQLNVTRIVIAHRLSTIRNADRIYVIKSGRVVEQGNFDELAAQNGVFSQLIKHQMA